MRELLTIERATGKVVGREVRIPVEAVSLKGRQADADAMVPWLKAHNVAFEEMLDFGDGDLKHLIVCSCGWENFDRLLSRVSRAFDTHAGTVHSAPVSIGMLTVEV